VLSELTAEQATAAFAVAWDNVAARTWNRHRSTLRSFTTWTAGRGWIIADLVGPPLPKVSLDIRQVADHGCRV
jgi:hypothetical protein